MISKREQFFHVMFSGLEEYSQIEFRIIQSGEYAKTSFFYVNDDFSSKNDFIEEWNGKRNVFFGIYPRKGSDGTDKGIKQLTCCYADIDVKKDHGNDWVGCCRRVKDFEYKPSITVKSGNGLHCYWVFAEPVTVTYATTTQIKEIIRGVAAALGGDANIIRLSHPFRVPETWNTKDLENKIKCELVEINECRYSIADFNKYRVAGKTTDERKKILATAEDEDIEEIINLLEVVKVAGNQIQAYCPFHEPRNSPSFYIKLSTGEWYCHSTSCEEPNGGGIRTFWRKWDAMKKAVADEQFKQQNGKWRI